MLSFCDWILLLKIVFSIMIHLNTMIPVSDNSGAKIVKCIKVLGSTGKKVATIGDVIAVSVRTADPKSQKKVSVGQVYYAIIVRVKSKVRRQDGSYISFDENAAVLLNKSRENMGTRVFGPVAREVKAKGFAKIASLASEIV